MNVKHNEVQCKLENCELIASFSPPTKVIELKGLKYLEVKFICPDGHISAEHKLLQQWAGIKLRTIN